uniref:Uncharacterized protein n=1 Tax=Spumella elongata TaxID=89044 RepID=A0A7S3HIR4_9STRA|mmetsp:Transcript_5419/g.9153  ORF Transcript_5419/g.9153 Transcript_5419/m.9153 type:complete len:268 (+) Transcript_5419:60-863(+)|eukprot:CAMPEP_0185006548 /NCGR_PEP_ID=MMETSP1098-20130426/84902_1 /TAXON_ID=89044 /ORGANISM="Spumella elongata, Strain CCAP 955/1" /LENGTH=267 /DNA_ID=CAMNT_0027534731 /DNA_START=60 /DNA_END=863 /DNA_ORIENTATION=-
MSKSSNKKGGSSSKAKKTTIEIDPSVIRFTHARIRPYFTGCGKKIEDTIKEITDGVTTVEDLPLITVIENDGEYFSLNNRRLYTIKHVQSLGLLKKPTITAFIKPALDREKTRYTAQRCALQAKIMLEREAADSSDNDQSDEEKVEKPPHNTEGNVAGNEEVDILSSAMDDLNVPTKDKKSSRTAKAESSTDNNDASAKTTKEKAAKSKVPAIPADILDELKDFSKLVAKGKTKAVLSFIDEWEMGGRINDAQRSEICRIVGLPVPK